MPPKRSTAALAKHAGPEDRDRGCPGGVGIRKTGRFAAGGQHRIRAQALGLVRSNPIGVDTRGLHRMASPALARAQLPTADLPARSRSRSKVRAGWNGALRRSMGYRSDQNLLYAAGQK